MRINSPFLELYKIEKFYIIVVMLFITVISAITSVYVKHKTRMLHVRSQKIYNESSILNTEWSNLLLEKSNLISDARVERLAKDRLNMINPEQIYIIAQE